MIVKSSQPQPLNLPYMVSPGYQPFQTRDYHQQFQPCPSGKKPERETSRRAPSSEKENTSDSDE